MMEDIDNAGAEQLSFQQSAFDALERDFREVLNELVGDKTLERFRVEYEKLHATLKRSHDNEKRLIKKCRQLNQEIVGNAAKIQTALRLSLQDQNSIALLKKEIDKAWRMVDSAQEKEKRARDNVQKLKNEISNLTRLVDQGAGLSIGQENTVSELLKRKEELKMEIENAQKLIVDETHKAQSMEVNKNDLERKVFEGEKEVQSLKDKNVKIRNEAQREIRRADRLEQERLTIQELNDKRKHDLLTRKAKHDDVFAKYSELETRLGHMRTSLEKFQGVAEELKAKNDEYENRIAEKSQVNSKLIADREILEKKFNSKSKEVYKKLQEVHAGTLKLARMEKDNEVLKARRDEAERYRAWLKDEMKAILKSVDNQRKDVVTDEKLLVELKTQAKNLDQSLTETLDKNQLQFKLVTGHEKVKQKLTQAIKLHKEAETALRKKNYNLEKEREKQSSNASLWYSKYQDAQETLKLKQMESNELGKQVADEANKLKAQRALYEQVRRDRNAFSKQQVQSEDEIAEMKKKFKIMEHQIDQLKEEIQQKDNALINAHFNYKTLQDEMKMNKRMLAKRRDVLHQTDNVLESQDSEIKNLRRTLKEAEVSQKQQKKLYDEMVQERDILGTQLIRRNDELALIYEKLRIQQATLHRGEILYRERLEDISGETSELNNLKRILQIRSHEVTSIEALKNQVYLVQRELLQERTKVKALSEELENPANIHRWRRLKGSDRKRSELVEQIQKLQKRLIVKTEEVVEADLLLQEKEKLYGELEELLKRQPGPEVAEQLSVYQHELRGKTRTMKSLAAELNMFQAQVIEYRYEAQRLKSERDDVVRTLYQDKRKQQNRSMAAERRARKNELEQQRRADQEAHARQSRERLQADQDAEVHAQQRAYADDHDRTLGSAFGKPGSTAHDGNKYGGMEMSRPGSVVVQGVPADTRLLQDESEYTETRGLAKQAPDMPSDDKSATQQLLATTAPIALEDEPGQGVSVLV